MKKWIWLILICSIPQVRGDDSFAKVTFPADLEAAIQKGAVRLANFKEVKLDIRQPLERRELVERFTQDKIDPATNTNVRTAKAILRVPPVYPFEALRNSVEGSATGFVVVSKEGLPKEIYVGNYTNTDFAKAVALALAYWKFQPSDRDSFAAIEFPFSVVSGIEQTEAHNEECSNPQLRTQLLERLMRDQSIRHEAMRSTASSDSGFAQKIAVIDDDNTAELKKIISEMGWPSRSMVGIDGTNAAFVLLQHSEYRLQKKMLPTILAAMLASELPGDAYALLRDRVLISEGEPQLYGTQARPVSEWKGHTPTLEPINDPQKVDQRRAELGMPPLAFYVESLRMERFHDEN
jgi:hypothetical protein